MRENGKFSVRQIAFAGILGAITVVLGSTPLGFIPVPPISVTTMHIPTIIAGVMEGPVIGGIVGAMFGGFSMWKAQSAANPLDKLIFSNPVIALIPRILVGVIAHYVFVLAKGKRGRAVLGGVSALLLGYTGYSLLVDTQPLLRFVAALCLGTLAGLGADWLQKQYGQGPALAAAAGSLTNTVLVLGLIAAFGHLPPKAALTIGMVNGVPEAAVAVILTGIVYRAIVPIYRGGGGV